MHSPHSRGLRGGRRGHPPHGWREPPGTQTPLPQTRATALPSPLSSRHCLRLSAGGRVRLRGCRLLRTMQREWHSNLLLLLVPTLEVTSLANITMLACYSALLMPTGTALVQQQLAGSSVFIACSSVFCCILHACLHAGSMWSCSHRRNACAIAQGLRLVPGAINDE